MLIKMMPTSHYDPDLDVSKEEIWTEHALTLLF